MKRTHLFRLFFVLVCSWQFGASNVCRFKAILMSFSFIVFAPYISLLRKFIWQMKQHFPEFLEKGKPREVYPNFSEMSQREFPFHIFFSYHNTQNLGWKISLYKNSTISGFSENFPRKFPYTISYRFEF